MFFVSCLSISRPTSIFCLVCFSGKYLRPPMQESYSVGCYSLESERHFTLHSPSALKEVCAILFPVLWNLIGEGGAILCC
jgi:hypothetical protein